MCDACKCCDPDAGGCSDPNPQTIPPNAWTPIPRIGRGTLVIPIHFGSSYDGGLLLARLKSVDTTNALRGNGRGIHLPCPGVWSLNWSGRSNINVLMLDVYCGQAFHAFAQKGYNRVTESQPTLAASANTLVLAANAYRKSAILASRKTNSGTAWISFGNAASNGGGFPLEPGEKYALVGDACHPFAINAWNSSADVINVVEGD